MISERKRRFRPVKQRRGPGEEAVCVPADSVLRELAGGGIRYCRHRIFGRGRVLGVKNGNLVELEFPGYGRKTIIASYLIAEKEHG